MLVGTYTSGNSKGIYTFRFNEETGESLPLSDAEVANPSYLIPSADGKFVYSVNEFSKDQAAVSAFAFDKEKGTLHLLNTQKTMGADPCYLTTNGKNIVTANYSGGSITVFPIGQDGALLPASDVIEFKGSGPDKERQTMPHLHCVRITPDGKYLLADDLGTDQIHKFNINPNANADNKEKFLTKGTPEAFKVAPGSGPRHLIFNSDGKFAYLINEIGGTVIAFRYADGMLDEIQTVAADTVNAQGSGDIHLSPDGKYLVWLILLSSWGCDTFAYCAGKLFGKHKMTPKLSPKKTVEGAIGGVVGAAVLGFLYGTFFKNNMIQVINPGVISGAACAIAAVISMVGDLAASAIKRNHDIKDYGNLIPGHGGILDRFDSMIFTAPAIYFAITFMGIR